MAKIFNYSTYISALSIFLIVYAGCKPKSEYSFTGKELCNGPNGPIRFLELDTFRRYGSAKPYHIYKSEQDKSINVSFKIIEDCCQEPVENLVISEFEIIIKPKFKGEKCDCVCDYFFNYQFEKDFVANRRIEIQH